MTFFIRLFSNFFRQPKSYFFFGLSSREKKKIIFKAVKESNEMQLSLLEKYSKQFPQETQKFYSN